MPDSQLYFAYSALLDPIRMANVAPDAEFLFSAHYAETGLVFVNANGNGAVPSLVESPGSTVWGGVFEISSADIDSLVEQEAAEGRQPGWEHRAIDRAGNKHECLTFVCDSGESSRPTPEYVETMIRGARHWKLPAGWVVGLEDLVEDPLFG